MPFKLFANGQVLTASDVMDNMMNQQIMVFADATARDAALTDPSEGMFCFLKDQDRVFLYDGANWRLF